MEKKWSVRYILTLLFCGANIFFSDMAEATIVPVNLQVGYKVDIDDSSVYMIGPGHANVRITPYYARWNPSYAVEVLWGDEQAVYRLDKEGNRKGAESKEFAVAIVKYMAENYPINAASADVWAYETDKFTYYVVSDSVIHNNVNEYIATVKYTDASGNAWTNTYRYVWANAGFWWVRVGETGDKYPVEADSREAAILQVIRDIAQ